MKCHSHPQADAVGICFACMRGVCADCAVDQGRGLACRGRCEAEVRRLLDLRDFSYSQPNYFVDRERQRRRGRWAAAGINVVIALFVGVVAYMTSSPQLMWVPAFCVVVALLVLFARGSRVRGDRFRLCPRCGYNVTGNTTGLCPECGMHL